MRIVRVMSCSLCAVLSWCCAKAGPVPIGLVLSGGGAKGAYEVGVWQALQDAGLSSNIKVISGTSVGAINAALFATNPDAAEKLWFNHIDNVFTLNTNRVGQSIQKTLDTASESVRIANETGEDWRGWGHFVLATLVRVASNVVDETESKSLREGYFDSSRLAVALKANLPSTWPPHTPAVYVTALEKGAWEPAVWRLNDETQERRILMIRASSAIPVGFDTVEIGGTAYVDGGFEVKGGDNVPINPILDNHPDVRTVIVVYLVDMKRLHAPQRDRVRRAAEQKGVKVVEIIPSEDTGGFLSMFKTSPDNAKKLIKLGRKDAHKVLKEAGLVKPISSVAKETF